MTQASRTCAWSPCSRSFIPIHTTGRPPRFCSPACLNAARMQRYYDNHDEAKAERNRHYREVIAPRRKAERAGQPPRVLKRDQPCIEECGRLVGSQGAKGRCSVCNQRLANAGAARALRRG